ncbi:ATP-dependent Clp protease proteolytic subunit [Candidatus Gracilibacteria bacterium]|nr:ATP-dependent Clp protease proteolytic subunit [Thermales bacterium]NJL96583.1 ATP-dependent Clp protease proteolytic subunit [Candidatus Gracilibacteria bacterium]
MPLVPMVIKKSFEGERSMDLYSRLLDERIILLTEPFDDSMAGIIVAQLLYLQSEDNSKDITMYVNSPGGSIVSMWSIIDTMNLIKPDISTVCVGMAASAASLVMANGAKGKRFILPHAQIMIHQPLGGAQGQASDIEISAKQILKAKELIHQFMSNKTGQKLEKISKDMDRDYFLDAKESLSYGIVDQILKD